MNAVQKISNQKLDLLALDKYTMSIDLRIDGLSFCVLDGNSEIHMEHFDWLNSSNWDNTYKNLSALLANHEVLKLDFKKTIVFIQSPNSFLVPSNLFDKNRIGSIYEKYFAIDNHEIFHNEVVGIENRTYLIYGIENRIFALLNNKWNNITWKHFSTHFINECLDNKPIHNEIYLKFQINYFEAVALKNGKLDAHNYFHFNTAEDFMFKLLSFVRQIGLELESPNVILSGKINESSALHQLMKKYISKVDFKKNDSTENNSSFYELVELTKNANR